MAGSLKSRETGPFSSSYSIGGPSRLVSDRDALDEKFVSSRGTNTQGNPTESQANAGWEIRLSLGQLLVLWSVVAGTMLMVFLFGLYAGREQGVQAALEGSSGEAMRLPVANDAGALKADTSPLASLSDAPSAAPIDTEAHKVSETAPSIAHDEAPATAPKDSEIALAGLNPEKTGTSSAPVKAEVQDSALGNKVEKVAKATVLETKPSSAEIATESAPALSSEKLLTKAEKNEAPKTVRAGSLSPGWYLQVAAARTSKEATGIGRKLRAAGLAAVVESAEVKGAAYYRVVLGPYASKDAAWNMRKAALASNAAKGEPFLKQVK